MGLEFYSIYNWVKILHISFVVAWMAGLLYLPRLFVYHSGISITTSSYNLLLLMENRLIKIMIVKKTDFIIFSYIQIKKLSIYMSKSITNYLLNI